VRRDVENRGEGEGGTPPTHTPTHTKAPPHFSPASSNRGKRARLFFFDLFFDIVLVVYSKKDGLLGFASACVAGANFNEGGERRGNILDRQP
jgi:hypothetical protein